MEEQFCRPATIADLMNLIASLNAKGAHYILIGGYALYAHGIHRATEDIDLLAPANREAAKPIIQALMMLPDKTAAEIEPEWFEEGENIRLADEYVVDLILSGMVRRNLPFPPDVGTGWGEYLGLTHGMEIARGACYLAPDMVGCRVPIYSACGEQSAPMFTLAVAKTGA